MEVNQSATTQTWLGQASSNLLWTVYKLSSTSCGLLGAPPARPWQIIPRKATITSREKPYLNRCLDAEGAASGASTILMGLRVKVKVSVQPLDVFLRGCSRLTRGIFARDPPDVPGDACDTPAQPILMAAEATPWSGRASTGTLTRQHKSSVAVDPCSSRCNRKQVR